MGSEGAVYIPPWGWWVFGAVVCVMLVIDLVAHQGEEDARKRQKKAGIWTAVWITLGLAFTGFVWQVIGGFEAQQYLAAYLLEKSLSLDNLFVFYIIFHGLGVPEKHHHKVLFWGILGALFFRAIFIFAGVALVEEYAWVMYVFGAILLYAAYRTYLEDPTAEEESKLVNWLAERLPLSKHPHEGQFFAIENGRRVATSLFVALVAIELTDILFAIDSVAAALSVTQDEFILYSANIFAILGLRSLYLFLESTVRDFRYLHYGLSAVLAFAALKLILHDVVHIPPLLSVAIIVVIISAAIWTSLRADKKPPLEQEAAPEEPEEEPEEEPAPRSETTPAS